PPTQFITLKPIAQTNYPPFLGVKFRVEAPLTLFCFLNTLVFPAF
ncbi:type II toxin-antitoxin system YafQ family toxin, partial [Helicobacter pylori]